VTLVNHGPELGSFHLYVPITIRHEWGALNGQIPIRVISSLPTEAEPYAVLSENNTKLTFYYDNQKELRNGMSVGPFDYDSERWGGHQGEISSVVIDASFADYTSLTSTAYWFHNCSSLTAITGIENLKTDDVTNMNSMFSYCSRLISLDLSSFNTSNVTNFEGIFSGCSSLASIQVGSAEVPAEEYAHIQNPNLLVYVNEARLAPEGIQNVVVNGVAQEIVLKDTEGNNNWFCPMPFTADKISYTRDFRQQTQIGISRGWESIALPFTVQSITHEQRGTIAPFGNDASDLHFWLRRLGYEGLASAQMIEANAPYVISMPNSSEYASKYNLSGRVTFSAEHAFVPESEPMIDESRDYAMVPTFQRVGVNENIYVLNVGEERDGHPEGSIFERNYREVRPFEAYTLHNGIGPAPQYLAISDLTDGNTTEIEAVQSLQFKVQSNDEWYTLDGRKLQNAPTAKGVYIQNGVKVVIK